MLWDSNRIHDSLYGKPIEEKVVHNFNIYSFIRLLGLSPNFLELCMKYDQLYTMIILLHYMKTLYRINTTYGGLNLDSKHQKSKNLLWINRDFTNLLANEDADSIVCPKTSENIREFLPFNFSSLRGYVVKCLSTSPRMLCSSTTYIYRDNHESKPRVLLSLLLGSDYQQGFSRWSSTESVPRLGLSWIPMSRLNAKKPLLNSGYFKDGIYARDPQENLSNIEIPSFESLIADSCKLQYLNTLMPKLKAGGHRVLIFCQVIHVSISYN
jgi:hypothetical protein